MTSDEIEAMLRAEVGGEVDAAHEFDRLQDRSERLLNDREENQRMTALIEGIDAEIDADTEIGADLERDPLLAVGASEFQVASRLEDAAGLSAERRGELTGGRHVLITAYYEAEQAVAVAAEANDAVAAAITAERSPSSRKRGWLVEAPLAYLVAETVIGAVLIVALAVNFISLHPLGLNTGTFSTLATAAALIAVAADRGLRSRGITLEQRRKARQLADAEAVARQALMNLDLRWSDLDLSIADAVQDINEQMSVDSCPPIAVATRVLQQYTSAPLREDLTRTATRRSSIRHRALRSTLRPRSDPPALPDRPDQTASP